MAIDPERITSWRFPEVRHAYTAKDTILYALGVGCGADPADLRYVFEDGLRALPSMATVLGYPGFWLKDPATGVDWRRAVHAGQAVKLFRPLPPEGCLLGRSRVTELFDKGAGRGALVVTERVLLDEATGAPLALLTHTAFLRGQGGFGGDPGPSTPPVAFPDRPADATVARSTLPQAALIYRLSGDMNPLHADPGGSGLGRLFPAHPARSLHLRRRDAGPAARRR